MSMSSSTTSTRHPAPSLPDMMVLTLQRRGPRTWPMSSISGISMVQYSPNGRNSWPTTASISCERVAWIRVEPNPRCEGGPAIGGPPVSAQMKLSIVPDVWSTVHDTASDPEFDDSAPYLAALLASSWNARAKDSPALGVSVMLMPAIETDCGPRS